MLSKYFCQREYPSKPSGKLYPLSLVGGGRPLSKKIESFISEEDIVVKVKGDEGSSGSGSEEGRKDTEPSRSNPSLYMHTHMTIT